MVPSTCVQYPSENDNLAGAVRLGSNNKSHIIKTPISGVNDRGMNDTCLHYNVMIMKFP